MIEPPDLRDDEWRQVGIATLTAACVAAATGLVSWAFEEGKRALERRHGVQRQAAGEPPQG